MTGSRVVRGGMKLFAGRMGVTVISLIFYAVAARVVDDGAALAPLAVMAIAAELFRVLGGLGLSTALQRRMPGQLAEGRAAEAAALLRGVLLYTALATLVPAALCWWARHRIAAAVLGRALEPREAAFILAFAFLMCVYDVLQIALLARQEFGRQSVAYVVMMVSQRAGGLALLLTFGMTACLGGFAAGALLGVLLCALLLRRALVSRGGVAGFRGLARYALPYWPQGVARYVFHEGDQLAVALVLSPEVLAVYFLAKRIARSLRMLIDTATDAFRPRLGELASAGNVAVEQAYRRAGRFLAYLVLPVTLGCAAVSGPLMQVFAGERYAEGGPILFVLSLAMLAYAGFSRYEVAVHMLGRPADRLKVDGAVAIVTLLGYAAMVTAFHGMGIAAAQLIGFAVGWVAAAFALRHIQRMRTDRSAELRTLMAAGVMFLIVGGANVEVQDAWMLPVLIGVGAIIHTLLFASLLFESELAEIVGVLPRPLNRLAGYVLQTVSLVRRDGGGGGGDA